MRTFFWEMKMNLMEGARRKFLVHSSSNLYLFTRQISLQKLVPKSDISERFFCIINKIYTCFPYFYFAMQSAASSFCSSPLLLLFIYLLFYERKV